MFHSQGIFVTVKKKANFGQSVELMYLLLKKFFMCIDMWTVGFICSLRFEGKQQKYGLLSCPEMTAVDSSFSIQNAVSWFDHYLAALDCYIWTFGESLLNPDDIFSGTFEQFSGILAQTFMTLLPYLKFFLS